MTHQRSLKLANMLSAAFDTWLADTYSSRRLSKELKVPPGDLPLVLFLVPYTKFVKGSHG